MRTCIIIIHHRIYILFRYRRMTPRDSERIYPRPHTPTLRLSGTCEIPRFRRRYNIVTTKIRFVFRPSSSSSSSRDSLWQRSFPVPYIRLSRTGDRVLGTWSIIYSIFGWISTCCSCPTSPYNRFVYFSQRCDFFSFFSSPRRAAQGVTRPSNRVGYS